MTDRLNEKLSDEEIIDICTRILSMKRTNNGTIVMLSKLDCNDRHMFLNLVGESVGRLVNVIDDLSLIEDYAADYLKKRGIEVPEYTGLRIFNSDNKGMYDRIISDERRRCGR